MFGKSFIYVLKDPNTQKICYVGKSINPESRLESHIYTARKYQRTLAEKWIYNLFCNNQIPIMEIVEECDKSIDFKREDYWIEILSKTNTLLNKRLHNASAKEIKTYSPYYPKKDDRFIRQSDAAKLREVNRRTIWYWITRYNLPTVEVAGMKLIRQEDLINFQPPKPGPKGKGK